MSEAKIKDGTGTGSLLKVTTEGRAQVDAVTTAAFAQKSIVSENAYVAISTIQAISTADTFHGCLYMKNTGDKRILVHSIRSCANQVQKWMIYKNPTTGTLISGANAATVTNLNLASPKTAAVTAYDGGEGKTVTDGSMMDHFQNDVGHSEEIFTGGLILERGNSIAIVGSLAAAGDMCCRILFYVED